ncbi:hypothetical protein P280DRAFT_467860 [Massarina eburnea CBS 473.64]|uniref:Uncharacterized protein n=1 Tax=Massarina eburnea CBS 473.64 TaxID=1395130 RepID=A0A6A6S7Y7_9PLEO|nr:hypothetical protein P280DRAFT_467860 [Massarina eburnea CBS 473.64]
MAVTPRSSHVSDPALAPFLQPHFDPAEHLNAALPALSLSSLSSRPLKQGNAVPLADLSSQTADLLSQLNAHTTRLSTILTQLTDDILRSGARLAYEVEVLRGETLGLTETLTDDLATDVKKFLPGGLSLKALKPETGSENPATEDAEKEKEDAGKQEATAPPYISQLHTLTLVRTRLETIIKVFGEAMHWSLPPSEISLTSSLINISAPEPGSDASSREQKGKEFAASLRSEIADLLNGDDVEAANIRIQALRDLAQVWKGTAEEKARYKFVEGLAKMAEERQRMLGGEREKKMPRAGKSVGTGASKPASPAPAPQTIRGGFLDNLQRIRENYIQ